MKLPIVALTLLAAAAPVLYAREAAPRGMDKAKLVEIDARLGKLIDSSKIAGAVTLVARDGVIVQHGAYGLRNVKSGEKMTNDTIFRIYSMSKPITTTAVMMLVEEGKVNLNDPVSKHLPQLAEPTVFAKGGKPPIAAKREPTVRDLMRHTSGYSYGFIPGGVGGKYRKADVLDRDSSLDAMIEKLAKIPLQSEPGTEWRYSLSIDVLGAIVQAASGQKFEAFLAERIFKPLGMKDTAFYIPKEKRDRFTSQHGRGLVGKLRVSEPAEGSHYLKPPGLPSGGGGLCSTAGDYFRFCQMILNGGELDGKRLLKAKTVAQMTVNQLPASIPNIGIGDQRRGVGFGFGFSVRIAESNWGSGGRVGEIGWGGAASTHFWMLPEEGLTVITMRNFMPYQWTLERELKQLIYSALK